jgi:hypothetical protein
MKEIFVKLGLLLVALAVLVPTFFGPLYLLVIHPELPASRLGRVFASLGADEHLWVRLVLCLPPMVAGTAAARAIAHLGLISRARNERT